MPDRGCGRHELHNGTKQEGTPTRVARDEHRVCGGGKRTGLSPRNWCSPPSVDDFRRENPAIRRRPRAIRRRPATLAAGKSNCRHRHQPQRLVVDVLRGKWVETQHNDGNHCVLEFLRNLATTWKLCDTNKQQEVTRVTEFHQWHLAGAEIRNCGISIAVWIVRTIGICLCATTWMSWPRRWTATTDPRRVSALSGTSAPVVATTTITCTTLPKTCNCGISTGLLHSQDHGRLSLHNSRHVNNLDQDLQLWNLHRLLHGHDHGHLLLNNGQVNNLSKICTCWISTEFCIVRTRRASRCTNNDRDATKLSMNCNCGTSTVFCAVRTIQLKEPPRRVLWRTGVVRIQQEETLRSPATSTVSACSTWRTSAVPKLSEVWRDRCRDEHW